MISAKRGGVGLSYSAIFFRKELRNETKKNRNDGFSRKRRYYSPVV